MAALECFTIAFGGHRARRGPLAWGQRWIWDVLADLGVGDSRLNMCLTVPVPEDRTTGDLRTVLSALVARHEMLRTTFGVDDNGEPVQVVHGSGEMTVRVRDLTGTADSSVAVVAEQFASELAADRFDLTREFPVRWAVIDQGGAPRAVVVVLAQMGFDGWSRLALAREIEQALVVGGAGAAEVAATEVRQPLDQVAVERSDRGAARRAATADYWQEMTTVAATMARPERRPRGERPRFWRAVFRSRTVAWACARVAARHRVMGSAVLLSALGTQLAHRLGQPACLPQVVFHNRFDPGTRDMLCHLAQPVPVLLDVTKGTFEELVIGTARRMLRASRFSGFDPVATARIAHGPGSRAGTHRGYPIVFNFQQAAVSPLTERSAAPEELAVPGLGSELGWTETVDEENLGCYINIYDPDEALMTFWVDTTYLSKSDIASVAFGTERLLLAAVDGDITLSEVCAVTDVLAPGLSSSREPGGVPR